MCLSNPVVAYTLTGTNVSRRHEAALVKSWLVDNLLVHILTY